MARRTRSTVTIFALDVRKGDVILDVNDDLDDFDPTQGNNEIAYVGDWCRGPDDEFNCRVGFKDDTHMTFDPTDVLKVSRLA